MNNEELYTLHRQYLRRALMRNRRTEPTTEELDALEKLRPFHAAGTCPNCGGRVRRTPTGNGRKCYGCGFEPVEDAA